MKIGIDRTDRLPIYRQLFEQIKSQIMDGSFMPGCLLPSERSLAQKLGVNRTTVLNAYRDLKAEGLIGSRMGGHTYVLDVKNEIYKPQAMPGPKWPYLINVIHNEAAITPDDEMFDLFNRRDLISFVGTWVSFVNSMSNDLPLPDEMQQFLDDYREDPTISASPDGLIGLRSEISKMLFGQNDLSQSWDMVITRGARHGIDLIAHALVVPGDLVLLEEPTCNDGICYFQRIGARLKGIPMKSDGMDLDALEAVLSTRRAKLIYTNPTCQNPCGITTSLAHRKRLVEIAHKYDTLIVEDDPFWGLTYDKETVMPTLKALDQGGFVIQVGTFSKVLSPRLEVGWLCGAPGFIKKVQNFLRLSIINSNKPSQYMLQEFFKNGRIWEHIDQVRKIDKKNETLFQEIMAKYARPGMRWLRTSCGPYKLIMLPPDISASDVVRKCGARGVSLLPGFLFTISHDVGEHMIRLCFRGRTDEEIKSGMKILLATIADLCEAPRAKINTTPDMSISI